MIATSGFVTALECTKLVFGRGSARTPLWELTALPIPLSWFKEAYFQGRGRENGKGKKEEKGREGDEKAGTGPPFANSWIRPWFMYELRPVLCTSLALVVGALFPDSICLSEVCV